MRVSEIRTLCVTRKIKVQILFWAIALWYQLFYNISIQEFIL